MTQMAQNRRRFLATLSAAGAAELIGRLEFVWPRSAAGNDHRSTCEDRTALCIAPQYLAEDFLRLEGFTDVQYVMSDAGIGQSRALARGEIDFSLQLRSAAVIPIDAGETISIIAGVHSGASNCSETNAFAASRISRAGRWGYKTWVGPRTSSWPPWPPMSGLIPSRISIGSQVHPIAPMELFAEGKIDAFLGFPPEPQELRARKIGRVIVNSSVDRPWSQYFCCMLAGNKDFIRKHPVATKRVLRAILKATDFCASEPDAGRAAHGRWGIYRLDTTMRSRR